MASNLGTCRQWIAGAPRSKPPCLPARRRPCDSGRADGQATRASIIVFHLMRNFSTRSPALTLAASQRGLRPRPLQVCEGSSGLAYLAATLRPLPPRPPNRSLSLKPAWAAIDSSFCRSSERLRSFCGELGPFHLELELLQLHEGHLCRVNCHVERFPVGVLEAHLNYV